MKTISSHKGYNEGMIPVVEVFVDTPTIRGTVLDPIGLLKDKFQVQKYLILQILVNVFLISKF